MSLSEETPKRRTSDEAYVESLSVKVRQAEREEIEKLTQEFLRKKGTITQCESGVNACLNPIVAPDFTAPSKRKINTMQDQSPITLVPYKNRTTRKSEHGQNIRRTKLGAYWVQMATIDLGRGEGWTKEQAIDARDSHRKACRLPPVDY